MLEGIIIVGFTMSLLEIIKYIPYFKKKSGKLWLPIISCLLCGALNILNAYIFSDIELVIALKEGLIMGALASGLYATGKKYLESEGKTNV